MPSECSGVDARNPNNEILLELLIQGPFRPVVGNHSRRFPNDIAAYPNAVRFFISSIDARDSNVWGSLHNNLPGVAWIGNCLLVPSHSCREDNLPKSLSLRSIGQAIKNHSVFQDQLCRNQSHRAPTKGLSASIIAVREEESTNLK